MGAELGTTYNDVLAPGDVAVYGALCSLASFSRPEMKTRIIDNIAFREFLELQPEVCWQYYQPVSVELPHSWWQNLASANRA